MGHVSEYRCDCCGYTKKIIDGPGMYEFYHADENTRKRIKQGEFGDYAKKLLRKLEKIEGGGVKVSFSAFGGGWYCPNCNEIAQMSPLSIKLGDDDVIELEGTAKTECGKCGCLMRKIDQFDKPELRCPKCGNGRLTENIEVMFD